MAAANFNTQKDFDLWAADFSLPIYPIDENGDEIPDSIPIEYDFDYIAYREAEAKADELNAVLKFFKIELKDGYYEGIQCFINENNCPDEWWMEYCFDFNEYGVNRYILKRMIQAEKNRINRELLPVFKNYGFDKYAITARFSNGETWYSKVA